MGALVVPALSTAQQRALAKIEGGLGHGYGEGAYLSRPTAKALARKGLIVLGTRPSTGGRRLAWAVAAGAEALPYGWESAAEAAARYAKDVETCRAYQQGRREKVIATARAARIARQAPVDAAWEAEARRLLEDLRVLAQAEAQHAKRAAENASA